MSRPPCYRRPLRVNQAALVQSGAPYGERRKIAALGAARPGSGSERFITPDGTLLSADGAYLRDLYGQVHP